MKETLAIINEMQSAGVISKYAIGGAVGALFYLEPTATVDIDIFVSLEMSGSLLTPIYDFLTARGFKAEKEYFVIGDWPVQFLPPENPLVEEALNQAISADLEGIPTRIMTAEHLAAIALRTGRGKDLARIIQFVDSGKLNSAKFEEVLRRHGLLAKWETFGERFLRND